MPASLLLPQQPELDEESEQDFWSSNEAVIIAQLLQLSMVTIEEPAEIFRLNIVENGEKFRL